MNKLSTPLAGEISAALNTISAFLGEWLDECGADRQEFIMDARQNGHRLFVGLFPDGARTLSVGLLAPSGRVLGLGAVTFDTVDPSATH
jgi:hypothetical protein